MFQNMLFALFKAVCVNQQCLDYPPPQKKSTLLAFVMRKANYSMKVTLLYYLSHFKISFLFIIICLGVGRSFRILKIFL